MNFTTKISIEKSNHPINYNSKIVALGSCFAENMAQKFEYFKFQNTVNPFGIIFNIVSIEKLIFRSIHKHYFTEKDIFFHNENWHCYEVHSELSSSNKKEFLDNLNAILDSTNKNITEASHFLITLGTAWVYRNIETNEIVANCHKVPQKQFTKELLSIETIQESLQNTITLITEANKEAKFIFTVSPVRHIKDGFFENNVSKAHLITAIHNTVTLSLSKCNYFPSYEIMMDELRDYRFYAEDMLHPNPIAINYIWEQFGKSHFSEETFLHMKEIDAIQKRFSHKPFNLKSVDYQNFKIKTESKITILQEKLPHIVF